ncbi:MAG: WG repeat-containing protein, partial [Tannerella sp.]|nr:WG repeat-containing protein [Tannerella sp.]
MKKIFTLLFLIVAVSISAQKVNLTRLQDSDTDKWGLVNARGDWVIKPIFDAIYSENWFFNHRYDPPFAVVKYKNKIGCIDQKGKWVVKPVFPAEIIGQSLADNAGQQWSQQQPLGKALYPLQDTETEKYGFVNAAGNWAILPKFDAFSFNCAFNYNMRVVDFAVVKYKGKWGAINKKEEWIVKPVYESSFDTDFAAKEVAESSDIAVPASQVANYYDKPTNGFQWEGVVEKTKPSPTTTQTPPITTPSAQTTTTTTPAQTTTAIVKPPTLKIISPSATATYDLNKVTIRYEAKKSDGSNAEIIIAIDGAPLNTNTKGVRRASDEIEIPLPTKEGIRNIALTAVDTKNDLHSATQYLSLTFKG